jgi:hypothetical protein
MGWPSSLVIDGVIVGTVAFLCALIVRVASEPAMRRRALARARPTRIAEVRSGVVRLDGVVRLAGAPARLPLSGAEAIGHDTTLVITPAFDRARIAREVGVTPFYVEDESGRALVQVASDELDLDAATPAEEPLARDSTEALAFAARRRVSTAAAGGVRLSYRQARLAPGDRVSVLGEARWESPPSSPGAGPYREAPRELVIRPLRGKLLVRRRD